LIERSTCTSRSENRVYSMDAGARALRSVQQQFWSLALHEIQRYRKTDLISQMYKKLGNHRSTSRDKAILEAEKQVIEDRFGDIPM
jgi:hypothetical protein